METNQSFVVVLLFFLLHSVTSCSSLSTKNIVTDGDALLALKARITHDPNNLLTSNCHRLEYFFIWSCGHHPTSTRKSFFPCIPRHQQQQLLRLSS
ncbi:hypothetical protein ACOSQ2_003992 [Xanthoceras sorbifolium]